MPPRGKRAGSASRDDSRRDRASRSGRQGVASSDDSDDEPDPPAEEAQPGNLQPLDKEELTRLVERFASLGFPLPKKIRNLSNEDARCPTTSTWRPGVSRSAGRHMHEDRSSRASSCTARRWRTASTTDAKLRELLQLPRGARWLRGGCSVPGGRLPARHDVLHANQAPAPL